MDSKELKFFEINLENKKGNFIVENSHTEKISLEKIHQGLRAIQIILQEILSVLPNFYLPKIQISINFFIEHPKKPARSF